MKNLVESIINKLNESINYDPFKKDMKIDDKNGPYTDGWGHRYSVKRDKSDKIKYKGLDFYYDYKKKLLIADDGPEEVIAVPLSIGDWLDNPELNIELTYDKGI